MADLELFAVYGPTAPTIHLYSPGFRTTKHRSYAAALCGPPAHLEWGMGHHGTPTGRVHIPLAEAVQLERIETPQPDPRPSPGRRRWCGKCIGIALVHLGHPAAALDLIIAITTPEGEAS